MAEKTTNKRTKAGKTIIFGLLSAGLYAGVFINADVIMSYFTKGGWFATLPIGTAFVFSYIHGVFAGNFWSLLGIESHTVKPRVEQIVSEKTQRPRPRLRLRAS